MHVSYETRSTCFPFCSLQSTRSSYHTCRRAYFWHSAPNRDVHLALYASHHSAFGIACHRVRTTYSSTNASHSGWSLCYCVLGAITGRLIQRLAWTDNFESIWLAKPITTPDDVQRIFFLKGPAQSGISLRTSMGVSVGSTRWSVLHFLAVNLIQLIYGPALLR